MMPYFCISGTTSRTSFSMQNAVITGSYVSTSSIFSTEVGLQKSAILCPPRSRNVDKAISYADVSTAKNRKQDHF